MSKVFEPVTEETKFEFRKFLQDICLENDWHLASVSSDLQELGLCRACADSLADKALNQNADIVDDDAEFLA